MEMASLVVIAPLEVRKRNLSQQDVRVIERETLNFRYSVVRAVFKAQARVELIAVWTVQQLKIEKETFEARNVSYGFITSYITTIIK
jgi:hypothetical protein